MARSTWREIEKRRSDRAHQLMRDGDWVTIQWHKREYRVFRDGSEYLVMEAGTRVQNPHPAIIRKAKTLLDREAVQGVMES